jgi:VWFA-related protein
MRENTQDPDVVRISTNLVQVDAVVTKDGKQVIDLKAQDFEIFEDGRPQKITNFSYISNILPTAGTSPKTKPHSSAKDRTPIIPARVRPDDVRRTVALIVDDLGMSFESVNQARRQVRKLLTEQLEPNDLVAIIRTGSDVGALQQFTTDRRLLMSALDRLRWNHCSRAGLNTFPTIGNETWGGDLISLCSRKTQENTLATMRFVLQGMRDLPGRKSMIVVSEALPVQEQEPGPSGSGGSGAGSPSGGSSSGFPTSTSYQALLEKIAEIAIRGSVVIYAVDPRGLQTTGLTAADRGPNIASPGGAEELRTILSSRSQILEEGQAGGAMIAKQTGGFMVKNSNDLGFKRVLDDQRGYYLIGYRPTDQTFNRRFHHIKVRTRNRGLIVRTREGFYGVTEDEARPPLTARDQMNRVLISPFGANEINVRLTTLFVNDAAAGSLLRSFIYVDARGLTFTPQPDGAQEASFSLRTMIFGDNGKVITEEGKTATLRLRDKEYDQVVRQGLVYSFATPVKAIGSLQFRVAVLDTISSRIGSAGQFIEVPNLAKPGLALSGIVISDGANLPDQATAQAAQAAAATTKQSQAPKAKEADLSSSPGVRRFSRGSSLFFAYIIYKALVDNTTHLPQLTTQIRVFRDGTAIYTGNPVSLDVTGQNDLQRLANAAELPAGMQLAPGQYVLQVIVEDLLAKEKSSVATQWIDFEVVE